MINVYNLSKSFDGADISTIALNNINLHIQQKEFVAIMGPSGSGKTTLLNIIGLLEIPVSGEVFFQGIKLNDLNNTQLAELRKGNIGFIFQNFNLIDELTVWQNVELPLKYLKIKPQERRERVATILKEMKISHRAEYYPYQLSGGQQQLVAVARAVITNPKLIIADEPTGNLDSATGESIMEILTELNRKGSTIIIATHNKRDAYYAHRVINLFDGSIAVLVNNI